MLEGVYDRGDDPTAKAQRKGWAACQVGEMLPIVQLSGWRPSSLTQRGRQPSHGHECLWTERDFCLEWGPKALTTPLLASGFGLSHCLQEDEESVLRFSLLGEDGEKTQAPSQQKPRSIARSLEGFAFER